MSTISTKDPADFVSEAGVRALQDLFAAAQPAAAYYANHLLCRVGAGSVTPAIAEAIVRDACAGGFGRDTADRHLWPPLEAHLTASGVSHDDFARLRAKHDEEFAAKEAEHVIEVFVGKLSSLAVDEVKTALIAAAADGVLLAAAGSLELRSAGSVAVLLGSIRAQRGCAGLVTTFVRAAVQRARDARKRALVEGGKLLASDSQVCIARHVLRMLSEDGEADIRFDEGRFYRFEPALGVWEEIPAHEISQCVHSYDGALYERHTVRGTYPAPLGIDASDVKGVKEVLADTRGVAAPGFFADGKPGVVVGNGVLVVDDDDEIVLEPHGADYRKRHRLEVDYDPEAKAPRLMGALDEWFENTPDAAHRKRFLAQFILLALFGAATLYQKALFLLGDSGTGKSTFLKIMKALFPRHAVSSLDPQELGHEYSAAELSGKLLNVGFDMSAEKLLDSSGFKKVTTGDTMTGRFPYEPKFTFEPIAAHAYALNKLPATRDYSNAVWDRVVIIEFPHDFRNDPTRRQLGLDQYVIEEELAGFLAWAVREGGSVFRDKALSIPPSSHHAVEGWSQNNDSIATWLLKAKPTLEYDRGAIRDVQRHYHTYRYWCGDFGFYPPNLNTFDERLHRVATPAVVWALSNLTRLEVPDDVEANSYARKLGVSAAAVRRKFNAYAKANGLPELSMTAFGRELRPYFEKVKSGTVYYVAEFNEPVVAGDDAGVVAIDTETHTFTDDQPVPDLICLSFCERNGEEGVLGAADGLAYFRQKLSDRARIVGHNIAYDLAVLIRASGDDLALKRSVFEAIREGLISDTQVREALLRCADGTLKTSRFKLAALVAKYLGRDISVSKKAENAWRLRYAELAGIDVDDWPEPALLYALNDARYTLQVWEAQDAIGGPITDEHRQVGAAWALSHLSNYGVAVDQTRATALDAQLMARLDELRDEIPFFKKKRGASKATLKISAVQERVEGYFPKGAAPQTKKGHVSTKAEVLLATGDEDLAKLAEYKRIEKLRSTFVSKLVGRDVVRGSYEVLKVTGRTSCSGPNLQQIPKAGGVRELLVPRPGYVLIGADYGTLELRTHAQVLLDWFGESRLADRLQQGEDLHLKIGATILEISYEEALAREDEPAVKAARTLAKAVNFGFPGGLSPKAFVDYARRDWGVAISLERAEQLKRAWLEAYPEMNRYFARIRQIVGRGRGRLEHVRSGRIRGGASFTEASNSFFQALASDGAKEALWLIVEECLTDPESPLWGSNPLMFIHDEIFIESPAGQVHEAGTRLEELMVTGMGAFVPDIPIVAEAVAMERWSKDAYRVEENGRLAVWTPDIPHQEDQ